MSDNTTAAGTLGYDDSAAGIDLAATRPKTGIDAVAEIIVETRQRLEILEAVVAGLCQVCRVEAKRRVIPGGKVQVYLEDNGRIVLP